MMEIQESETVELKKSTSELKEAVISIVSILNKHHKGELYFGIKNDGEVVGQDMSERTLRDISRMISDNIEPKIFPRINAKMISDKKIIHVEFQGNDAPYYAYGRLIAEMLHKIHFIEKWGRGISLILSKEPEADFKEMGRQFAVVFKRKEETARKMQKDGGVNGTLNGTLSGTLNDLLVLIKEKPGIQANQISEKLKRPVDTVKKQIKHLADRGLIVRKGSRKTGGYFAR